MSRQLLFAAALLALALPTACDKESKPAADKPASTRGSEKADKGEGTHPDKTAGKVVETMDSGGYTYVQLDLGNTKIWAAGPETAIKVGDTVSFAGGSPMKDFHSKTLDRTFETILFVQAFRVGDAAPGGAPASTTGAAHPAPAQPAAVEVSGVEKAEGGYTVGELFDGRAKLSGKKIAVRGKVTKVNQGIMGKNWIHLQDGTGSAGTNDLVVTTAPDQVVAVGNTILVDGTAMTDKDFGAGYKYSLIIEAAKVTVE